MHPIKAISLFVILAFGSVQLNCKGLIGEASLVTLLGLVLMVSLMVYFQDRLKKASISGFELDEKVRIVKDSEELVRELALSVLEVVESNEGGYKQPEWDVERYAKAKESLRHLLK